MLAASTPAVIDPSSTKIGGRLVTADGTVDGMRGTWTTVIALVALSACGGGDDAAGDESAQVEADGGSDGGSDGGGDSASGGAPGGISEGGTANLRLENGESFEFSLWCVLEPQESAGSEILFTFGSRDTPGLDVTQFGDEGTVTDIAVASVYGESFDTLWEASSFNEAFGGGFSLELDGSTVTGTGTFFAGGEIDGEQVEGELVANC